MQVQQTLLHVVRCSDNAPTAMVRCLPTVLYRCSRRRRDYRTALRTLNELCHTLVVNDVAGIQHTVVRSCSHIFTRYYRILRCQSQL